MSNKVSFEAAKGNSKLTDFEGLRDYVIENTVKVIPRVIKVKASSSDSMLADY